MQNQTTLCKETVEQYLDPIYYLGIRGNANEVALVINDWVYEQEDFIWQAFWKEVLAVNGIVVSKVTDVGLVNGEYVINYEAPEQLTVHRGNKRVHISLYSDASKSDETCTASIEHWLGSRGVESSPKWVTDALNQIYYYSENGQKEKAIKLYRELEAKLPGDDWNILFLELHNYLY